MGAFGSDSPRALARGTARSVGEFPLVQGLYTATGVRVPPGSLDRWFAARNAASLRLVEIALFGDSTMYGQTATGPYYSPAQRIRERYIAAGYADGGHGNHNWVDDVTSPGDSLVIGQGFAVSGTGVLPGESTASTTVNDNETFTRLGRYLTIWFSRLNSAGRFTYEIDGSGTEVPIDPAYPTPGSINTFAHTAVIDMGTDASHAIKIRNKGGRLVTAPTYAGGSFAGSGTGGTIATGTYDYAAAFVAPDGKIGPLGATRTVTVTLGQTFSFILAAQLENAGTTTNIYRRTSGVGNFKLVGSVATSNASSYLWTDTGAAAGIDYAQGAAPVLNSAMNWVCVTTNVTKATGIVLHNLSARGSGSSSPANPYNAALGLGLDLEPGVTVPAIDRALDASSGARRPVLTILTHGINDQQSSPADNSANYAANVVTAIRAARRAGSDVLVTLPCWETANQQQNAGLYRAAGKAAAEGEGAPWIDIGIGGALPSVTPGGTNPHLTIAQYQAQGDFIWDQLLGL